jgi:hypothetical protein
MMGLPQKAELIPFEGPRDLAAVTARLPVLFLPEPKASERFWEFFTATSATGTPGAHTTRRRAGSRSGVKAAAFMILRL